MGKRILVTAGPIPAYIDPVKIVTNGFRGGLAKRCAADLRDTYGHDVDLMVWENDQTHDEDWPGHVLRVHDVRDYVRAIRNAARNYDAIVCAAAVANLMPSQTLQHKFASHELRPGDAVSIPFEIAPRAVDEVKRSNPRCTLIAYKCLDADEGTLLEAAATVLTDARADVVFANTPNDAKCHKIAMFKDGATIECDFDEHTRIIDQVVREHHYRTKTIPLVIDERSDAALAHAMQQVRLFESTMPNHGTVAIPVRIGGWPDAFVTTARGHRTKPVLVLNVDDKSRIVYATDKATLNAPALMSALRARRLAHPNEVGAIVVHRHFDDPEEAASAKLSKGRVVRLGHIGPGTAEEAQAMSEAFSEASVNRVEIQGHGSVYIRHVVPIDWTRYQQLYPKRYMSDSPAMQGTIEAAWRKLEKSPKAAKTLEIGAGGDTECAMALDTSVDAKNARNIRWQDLDGFADESVDVTIMRNCIAYLSDAQLRKAFAKSRIVIANVFIDAPDEMLRDRECATCTDHMVTHSLLLDSDDLMTHQFRARGLPEYETHGAKVIRYGKNSILLTKGI